MILWRRAVWLGVLSWFLPFAVSFFLFPLKHSNAPLFGTLMGLVLLLTGGILLSRYFRRRTVAVREAVAVGALWLLLNLAFDYPMFAYGPMKMSAANYYSEIGLSYLIFPVLAFTSARLARS